MWGFPELEKPGHIKEIFTVTNKKKHRKLCESLFCNTALNHLIYMLKFNVVHSFSNWLIGACINYVIAVFGTVDYSC